jgi:hypothetical protein
MTASNDIMWDGIKQDLNVPEYIRDLAQRSKGEGNCLRCNYAPGVTTYCEKCKAPRLRYDARSQVIDFTSNPPREL